MHFFTTTIAKLNEKIENGTFSDFKQILCDVRGFPQQMRAWVEWKLNSHKAVYQCAPNLVTAPHHFDLNLPLYTHFTSPIRRYIDLVVHRFVSAMIHRSQMPPYTRNQIENLCAYCSDADANDLMYTETVMQIRESKMQPGRLIKYHGLVKEILEKSLSILLSSPSNQHLCVMARDSVSFSALNLHSKPERIKPSVLKLEWYMRIYDVNGFNPYYQNRLEMTSVHIVKWFQLLQHLKTNTINNLKAEIKNLPSSEITLQQVSVELESDDEDSFEFSTDDETENESESELEIDDYLTSSDDDTLSTDLSDTEIPEKDPEDNIKTDLVLKHFRRIAHSVQRGTAIEAWVVWQTYQEPEIKVIHFDPEEKINDSDNQKRKVHSRAVTTAEYHTILETKRLKEESQEEDDAPDKSKNNRWPGIDICIEHNNHPITCFSDLSVRKASMERYQNEKVYRDCWMPALSMESAVCAVEDGDRVILQNVTIHWGKDHHHVVIVKFELKKRLCDKYCIHFTRDDYVCVRFRTNPKMLLIPKETEGMWTGHFLVDMSTPEEEVSETVHVKMRLRQSCQLFPNLRLPLVDGCTLEQIRQPVSIKFVKLCSIRVIIISR